MNTNAKHTPTQWYIREALAGFYIYSDQNTIAHCAFNNDNIDHEHAAFIVRAVNSHEALVEALEASEERLRHIAAQFGLGVQKECTQARAALKLAKGEG